MNNSTGYPRKYHTTTISAHQTHRMTGAEAIAEVFKHRPAAVLGTRRRCQMLISYHHHRGSRGLDCGQGATVSGLSQFRSSHLQRRSDQATYTAPIASPPSPNGSAVPEFPGTVFQGDGHFAVAGARSRVPPRVGKPAHPPRFATTTHQASSLPPSWKRSSPLTHPPTSPVAIALYPRGRSFLYLRSVLLVALCSSTQSSLPTIRSRCRRPRGFQHSLFASTHSPTSFRGPRHPPLRRLRSNGRVASQYSVYKGDVGHEA